MPLAITPLIENQRFCRSAAADKSVNDDEQAEMYCFRLNETPSDLIEQLLGEIGPKVSPSGSFILGYTLNLSALSLYERTDDGWKFNIDRLRYRLKTIQEVDRPVVIYVSSNHFCDESRDLYAELSKNIENLMWSPSGPLSRDRYFALETCAWNIADLFSPLNRLRSEAFHKIGQEISRLGAAAAQKIVAVSVLGEVHHHYENFTAGMSHAAAFNVTDYSPASTEGFRVWLKQRYGDLAGLNGDTGRWYGDWSHISPPVPGDDAWSLTAHSHGVLCFHGWADVPDRNQGRVRIYIDGNRAAEVPIELSRTDVDDAVPGVGTANVGWRWLWDFSSTPSGEYAVDITIFDGTEERLVGGRLVEVANPMLTGPADTKPPAEATHFIPSTVACHIDYPAEPAVRVRFDPLGRLWDEYRQRQVVAYIEHFSDILAKEGVPREKIFSHQILPHLNSAWNSTLMGADAAVRLNDYYSPGFTLYGGSAYGDAFFNLKRELGWSRYGVAEIHPNRDLGVARTVGMIRRHASEGAAYLSPYYLSMRPERERVVGPHDRFWIRKDNPAFGSDTFFAALQVVMQHL